MLPNKPPGEVPSERPARRRGPVLSDRDWTVSSKGQRRSQDGECMSYSSTDRREDESQSLGHERPRRNPAWPRCPKPVANLCC